MPLKIGLTGGISSGKSTAAHLFEKLGAGVIDADVVSHKLTRQGQPALTAIVNAFGREYLFEDGQLDRARLRRLIFSDSAAKASLEALLHPLIRNEITAWLKQCQAPYTLVVMPLLFETGFDRCVERTLVIDCAEETQVRRARLRPTFTDDEVRSIMANQLPRAERARRADDTLLNEGTLDDLEEAVRKLHDKYLNLSRP